MPELQAWLAAVLCAAAIKLADAAADGEAGVLAAASGAWVLVLVGLAAGLHPRWTLLLCTAAWCLGMAQAGPGPAAGWRRWRRAILAALVALGPATLAGAAETAWALGTLAAVQAWDHWVDRDRQPVPEGADRRGPAVDRALALAWVLVALWAVWWRPLSSALVFLAAAPGEALGRWLGPRSGLGEPPAQAGTPCPDMDWAG
ncbi:MAG TPA: hypothetical protein VIL11_03980 [Limnochordales bacterium]